MTDRKDLRPIAGLLIVLIVSGGFGGVTTATQANFISFLAQNSISDGTFSVPRVASSYVQTGTVSITIPANQFTVGSTVTFSPAFGSVPNIFLALSTQIGTTPVGYQVMYSFLSTEPAVVWANMPAANTELFGSTDHELILTPSQFGNQNLGFSLGVTCKVASNTAGAFLQIQYSQNGGATWTNISGTVIIDNTKCNVATGVTIVGTQLGTLPASFNPSLFRVVGQGGGGAGDVPTFSQIYMIGITTSSVNYQLNHQSDTVSSTIIRLTRPIATTAAVTGTINWIAYVAANDPSAAATNPGLWPLIPFTGGELFGDTTHEQTVYLPTVTTALFEATLTSASTFDFFSGSYIWPQYTGDSGVSWHDLCGGNDPASGLDFPQIIIDGTVGGGAGLHVSASCSIDRSFFPASNFVTLRVMGNDPTGSGGCAPVFNLILLHVL